MSAQNFTAISLQSIQHFTPQEPLTASWFYSTILLLMWRPWVTKEKAELYFVYSVYEIMDMHNIFYREFIKMTLRSRVSRDSLAIQWLRLRAPSEEGRSSFPGWGTKITHAEQHVFHPPPQKKNTRTIMSKELFSLSDNCTLYGVCVLPHGLWPTARLLCPWDSPGKNTGVGCHAFFQRIFPTQGLNPGLLHCTSGRFFTGWATMEALYGVCLSLKAANTCIQCQKLLSILYVYSFIYPSNPMREGLRNLPTILD